MVLFTAAEYRAHVGSSDSSLDTLLGVIATQVSAAIDTYCRRTLEAPDEATTIYLSGSGTQFLFTPDFPIVSITSIHEDGGRSFGAETALTANTHYLLFKKSGKLARLSDGPNFQAGRLVGGNGLWLQGQGVVKVVYKAGYTSVPNDLKLAAIHWAEAIMARRGAQGVVSHNVGSFGETFSSDPIPPHCKVILTRYKRPPMEEAMT